MRHFSLRSASIELRTSFGKGDMSWPEPGVRSSQHLFPDAQVPLRNLLARRAARGLVRLRVLDLIAEHSITYNY